MSRRKKRTIILGQGRHPAVFAGVVLLSLTQGLRIPLGEFYSYINSQAADSAVSYVMCVFLILLILDLTAIWVTLPPSNKGVWVLKRFFRSKSHNPVVAKRRAHFRAKRLHDAERILNENSNRLPPIYPGQPSQKIAI